MTTRCIAVSGGPGAGKTTLWRRLAELHPQRVSALPEVATALFSQLFPQVQTEPERCAVQRAIFSVQQQLEFVYASRLGAGQLLLCDRGTPDGAGYWPEGPEQFFESMHSTWQAELARYDAVLFLESAAVGGIAVADHNNRTRTEDLATAAHFDARLRTVWQAHPRFEFVAHEREFAEKLAKGVALAERLLGL
ncbi:MAG: hypothetical protein RL701_6788 [Pseudomonadota bacterium]